MALHQRKGFSQVEVVVTTLIVGVLMVCSFSAIAASRRSQTFESNRVRGLAIAEALMAEITQMPMRDPACDCGFGPLPGETGLNRLGFNDVDDYLNLIDSPPKMKDGTVCQGYSDLSRTVAIDMVTASNWNTTTGTYAGVYRITVKVLRDSLEVCRVVAYRTSGSPGANSLVSVNSLN